MRQCQSLMCNSVAKMTVTLFFHGPDQLFHTLLELPTVRLGCVAQMDDRILDLGEVDVGVRLVRHLQPPGRYRTGAFKGKVAVIEEKVKEYKIQC